MDGRGWTGKWQRIAIYSSLARSSFRFKRAMAALVRMFEGATRFAEEVARKCLKTSRREGCIPECFVGHYRVKHDPGLHFPVNSWDALTAAPFRSVPPHCAEKTWPRFFIAARISSRDSVCFRPSFWSEWRSW